MQTQSFRPAKEGDPILSRSIWGYSHTVLGAVGIFLYVGVEVGLASIAVNYFKSQGVDSAKTASFLVSLYWFGALVGRLLGVWVLTKIKSGRLLGAFGFIAAALLVVSMFDHRANGDLDAGAVRILQLHHVPEYLRAGHCRTGPDDQQGLGTDYDGGGRRSGGSFPDWRGGRQDGDSALLRDPDFLLPVYCVLRVVGLKAEADCDGIGWVDCDGEALREVPEGFVCLADMPSRFVPLLCL